MAKTAFKVRNPDRDRKSDDLRIERLDKVLEDVIAEVRRERAGLRARYENSADGEIFPLDSARNLVGEKREELGESLLQCITRLRKLEAQEHVLQQMQQDLANLQGLAAA